MYVEDRDCTIDFMTSNGKAQHSAPLRMNAPAIAVDEIEKAECAVEGRGGEGGGKVRKLRQAQNK